MAVTLQELATFMKAPSLAAGDDAVLLQEHLDSAVEYVSSKVGAFDEEGLALAVHADARQTTLILPFTNAEEITSVTDPSGRDVPVGSLVDADPGAGIVEVSSPVRGTWTVTVRAPQASKSCTLATKIIAAHLWGTQRGTDGGRRPMYAAAADDAGATPVGFAIPRRAAQLLEPFLTADGFA